MYMYNITYVYCLKVAPWIVTLMRPRRVRAEFAQDVEEEEEKDDAMEEDASK
jgi:hypothetical protein